MANQRIEPMRGSAFRSVPYSGTSGALSLMAHPHRWGATHVTNTTNNEVPDL